jgi:hypothetical protein
MEIEIQTARGKKIEKVRIDKRTQVITLPTDGRPTKINFDPTGKIPIKTVKVVAGGR